MNLTPGSDVMFTIATGIKGGMRSGIAAAAGVALGSLCHVALATFGLAAIVATVPWALVAIKWIGVLYLVFLAFRAWTAAPPAQINVQSRTLMRHAMTQGCLTNMTNPKVALFIIAFLPQFIDETRGPVWAQMLMLGILFTLSGWVITSVYGIFAGYLGHKLKKYFATLNKLSAIILGALAVRLAGS